MQINNIAEEIIAFLADRKWHNLVEIVAKVGDKVMAEQAVRTYMNTNTPGDIPQDERIRKGRYRYIYMSLYNMVRGKKVEVKGKGTKGNNKDPDQQEYRLLDTYEFKKRESKRKPNLLIKPETPGTTPGTINIKRTKQGTFGHTDSTEATTSVGVRRTKWGTFAPVSSTDDGPDPCVRKRRRNKAEPESEPNLPEPKPGTSILDLIGQVEKMFDKDFVNAPLPDKDDFAACCRSLRRIIACNAACNLACDPTSTENTPRRRRRRERQPRLQEPKESRPELPPEPTPPKQETPKQESPGEKQPETIMASSVPPPRQATATPIPAMPQESLPPIGDEKEKDKELTRDELIDLVRDLPSRLEANRISRT